MHQCEWLNRAWTSDSPFALPRTLPAVHQSHQLGTHLPPTDKDKQQQNVTAYKFIRLENLSSPPRIDISHGGMFTIKRAMRQDVADTIQHNSSAG